MLFNFAFQHIIIYYKMNTYLFILKTKVQFSLLGGWDGWRIVCDKGLGKFLGGFCLI